MSNNKVLIVEDDRTLLDVLQYNLTKESYDVITATDGEQALDVARSEKPDLIVLDIRESSSFAMTLLAARIKKVP